MNADVRAQLIQAMLGGGAPSQRSQNGTALAKAMLNRMRINPRWASLAALPPYGESKFADSFNGSGPADVPAFQPDAFQDDAYQVF